MRKKIMVFLICITLLVTSFFRSAYAEPITTVAGGVILTAKVVAAVSAGIMSLIMAKDVYDKYSDKEELERDIAENQELQKEIRERAIVQNDGSVSYSQNDMSYITSMIKNEFMKNNALRYGATVSGDITENLLNNYATYYKKQLSLGGSQTLKIKCETLNLAHQYNIPKDLSDYLKCNLPYEKEGLYPFTLIRLSNSLSHRSNPDMMNWDFSESFCVGPNGVLGYFVPDNFYPLGHSTATRYYFNDGFFESAVKTGLFNFSTFTGSFGLNYEIDFNDNSICPDMSNTQIAKEIEKCKAIDVPLVYNPTIDADGTKTYEADTDTTSVVSTDVPIAKDTVSNPALDLDIPSDISLDFSPLYADLSKKFPFCIPWDIFSFIGSWVGDAKAPRWQGEFNFGNLGKIPYDIDFSKFDNIAKITRYMELVGFCIFLMVKSKDLINK